MGALFVAALDPVDRCDHNRGDRGHDRNIDGIRRVRIAGCHADVYDENVVHYVG